MTRYHVNPKTGEPGACRAMVSCPFGDVDEEHYNSKEDAREAYEKSRKSFSEKPKKWGRASLSSVPYRIYSDDEISQAKDRLRKVYIEINKMALGPKGDRALNRILKAHTPVNNRGRVQPVNPDTALKDLAYARTLIGAHNPVASQKLKTAQNAIQKIKGVPPVPKKNSMVEAAYVENDSGIDVPVNVKGKFLRMERVKGTREQRARWADAADREYAILKDGSGKEIRVPAGAIKQND